VNCYLTAVVTVRAILEKIVISYIVLPAIVIGVELTIDRLGFAVRNHAIQLASNVSNPLMALAANDLYSSGNDLIALGSPIIILGSDYTKVASGVTSVLKAIKGVAAAINDPFAASGKVVGLLDKMKDLLDATDRSAKNTISVLERRDISAATIKNTFEITTGIFKVLFGLMLDITTSGNTSDLVIE